MASPQNVFIVYAHQEPKSFNGALKDAAVTTLTDLGHKVTISDLYAMNFDPSAKRDHFKGELADPDFFSYQAELSHAAQNGLLPNDVAAEIKKLAEADLIILQFPIYWLGFPAILKGWVDRCLADHVAFHAETGRWFDNGNYKDKKLVLSLTTGGHHSFYTNRGVFGDIQTMLWPMQYGLRIAGFQILEPNVCYAPKDVNSDIQTSYLKNWSNRLRTIFDEDPLSFVHIQHFDPDTGFSLTDKYVESENSNEHAPTVGQHLGKPLLRHPTKQVPPP